MKFSAVVIALALVTVTACNKKEEATPAIQVVPVQGEVPPMNAEEGHDKEHHHVSDAVDHAHDEAHHTAHDHAAHHPNHDAEAPSDTHQQ